MLRPLILVTLMSCGSAAWIGCGTTRWTDTQRTATEQLLISDAVDRAVQDIDFRVLADKDVYFDSRYLESTVDHRYVISTLRQHLLASGCVLKEKPEEAEFIVEVRAGAVGTDRHDLLYGVPATNLPPLVPLPWVPSSVPEIPLVKRTDQLGVAKLAVFAFHRETGRPVWQSGTSMQTSQAKDIWVFGAGPFQKGTIYDGTVFAGQKLRNPLVRRMPKVEGDTRSSAITAEKYFERAAMPLAQRPADGSYGSRQGGPVPSPPGTPPPAGPAHDVMAR